MSGVFLYIEIQFYIHMHLTNRSATKQSLAPKRELQHGELKIGLHDISKYCIVHNTMSISLWHAISELYYYFKTLRKVKFSGRCIQQRIDWARDCYLCDVLHNNRVIKCNMLQKATPLLSDTPGACAIPSVFFRAFLYSIGPKYTHRCQNGCLDEQPINVNIVMS